jgi:hypothetical protein
MRCYGRAMAEDAIPNGGPEQMRSAMAEYIRALHRAYLDASTPLAPGDRARLPVLQAQSFTVAAIGTRYLHVIGTSETLPAPTGPEVVIEDSLDELSWTVRFFDPVVSPALGLIDESEKPSPDQVRHTLGIRSVVYHLTVPPGGGLTAHHALHAGTGLAHSHAAAHRDFASLAALRPSRGALIAEMQAAHVNDLPEAHRLLAIELVGPDAITAAHGDFEAVRRQTLQALREAAS